MNVIADLVASPQSFELMNQRLRLLGHITHLAQPAAVFATASSQMGLNVTATQLGAMRVAVISTIGVKRIRSTTRSTDATTHRRHRLQQRQQLGDIVAIGGGERGGQRRAAGVGQQVMLRAVFAAVHGAGACFFPPRTARTDAESTVARDQSIRSASWSLLSSS